MWTWLNGKKTIIAAVTMAIIGALTQEKVISADIGNTITIVLGALAAIFMRFAMGKPKQE